MARLCSDVCSLLNDALIKKLFQHKIFTVVDVLEEDSEKLVQILKLSYKEVLQVRHTIIANYAAFPRKCNDIYEDLVSNSALIPTGIASVDGLLGGGLLTDQVWELCGPAGEGKTQLCLAAACHAALALRQPVHYVDTQLGFSGRRLQAALEARAAPHQEMAGAMERVQVTRVSDSYQLLGALHRLKTALQDGREGGGAGRLVVVDSLAALFFSYLGEDHNDGLSQLNHVANVLRFLASECHVAVVVVNVAVRGGDDLRQQQDEAAAGTLRPALGRYWAHVPSTRLLLQDGTLSVAKSTHLPRGASCPVHVTDKGVE
ncbi:DNA repair protein RAD51 homolog 4-like [Bacillus rossius redtenbacheri]|uniref:DNA repair protein RAD51 homolog 4-like n=1 Tax=Bacillus rossius redtenbacheri TaxID=93214 RepID=UPI002FDCF210